MKGDAEDVENFARARWIEEVGHRTVAALKNRNLQLFEEAADRQPEVVADEDQSLQPLAIALPQRGGKFLIRQAPFGVQPLLELIEDQYRFLAAGQTNAATQVFQQQR